MHPLYRQGLSVVVISMCASLLVWAAASPVWCADDLGTGDREADPFTAARARMVAETIADGPFGRKPVEDPKVLAAMRTVKRHVFVPASLCASAYEDTPLPIGHGQTISQPYIVAFMTEALKAGPDSTVLEIGTGSGYQAAVLAELVKTVYTIEIVEPLGQRAERQLKEAGYKNVECRIGDGYYGWAEHAPFDAIIVTAAAAHIPPPLIEQLKPGGRMVIPVGPPLQAQSLMLVEKRRDGSLVQRNTMAVRFVPLTGGK